VTVRGRTIALVVLVSVCALGVFGWLEYRNHQVPWADMDSDLGGVQAPDGFNLGPITHSGRL